MQSLTIDQLSSGGIIVNYVCSSRCGHCLYRSSPTREKGYMTPETLRPCLAKVRELGCYSMHIGGGEPMLNTDALVAVLDTMRECGVSLDYLETNASWHKDDASTRRTLTRLMEHGCDTIMVSIDPFHNEYIPFNKMKAVIAAADRVGMRVFAWKMEFAPDLQHFDPTKPHRMAEYRQAFGDAFFRDLPSRYGLNLSGRALDTFRDTLPGRSADTILATTKRPCSEMHQTSHFHIDLYSNYVFTFCVGLAIACDDLGCPVDPQKYPHLSLLAAEGLPGLYRLATDSGFQPRKSYVHKCDLCHDLRRYLVMDKGIRTADLQPLGFYEDKGTSI